MGWISILKLEPEKTGIEMNHTGVFIDLLRLSSSSFAIQLS